ncbi:hypothetical protein Dxin01_00767 [Deinococcus xinjiangensis]|uniref:Uncharacterized protein n=1 Tax=Deinococcus xinjiangensis TaxID=457454 RepID=A0ABP9V8T9_9DEIO
MTLPYTQHLRDAYRPPQEEAGDFAERYLKKISDEGGAVAAYRAEAALGLELLKSLLKNHYLIHFPSQIGGMILLGPNWYAKHQPKRLYAMQSVSMASNLVYTQEVIELLKEKEHFTYYSKMNEQRHIMYDAKGQMYVMSAKLTGDGYSPRSARDLLKQLDSWLLSENAKLLFVVPNRRRLEAVERMNPLFIRIKAVPLPATYTSVTTSGPE